MLTQPTRHTAFPLVASQGRTNAGTSVEVGAKVLGHPRNRYEDRGKSEPEQDVQQDVEDQEPPGGKIAGSD
jgi:hypothetical protein